VREDAMADITIYIGNKNYSSWSMRPWLALKHIGVAFDEVMIRLDAAAVGNTLSPATMATLRRHSPSGRVPVLRHGATVVWESLAICEYLAEQFPLARLWPADTAARAYARAISSEMHAGFAALLEYLPMEISRRWPLGHRVAKVQADVDRVTAIWRECRDRFGKSGANGAGNFLFGGFSVADAMFAPVTTRFVTHGVPLDAVSSAYVAALQAWPPMAEWIAAARAEPWVIQYDVNAGSG
jgi:glutathione S-transferase